MLRNDASTGFIMWLVLFVVTLSLAALPTDSLVAALTPITNDNIRDAANLWLKDPESATEEYGPIEDWNTTEVRDMSSLFFGDIEFNSNLSAWDTSNVETMNGMFYGAESFNGNIMGWQTQNVKDFSFAFWGATAFNQTLCWEVPAFLPPLTDEMFCGSGGSFNYSCVDADIIEATSLCPTSPPSSAPTAKRLEPINDENIRDAVELWLEDPTEAMEIYGKIGEWDVSNVTNFSGLFEGAVTFNDDIQRWRTSSAIRMDDMFRGATAFNGDLSGFDTSNCISLERMFDGAESFTGQGLKEWQTGKVKTFFGMFHSAASFNGDLVNWNVSSCSDFSYMFMGSKFNRDLSKWELSSGASFAWMFHKAEDFNGNVASWKFSSRVIDMEGMFFGATLFDQFICWDLPMGTVTSLMFCNTNGAEFDSSCVEDGFIQESTRDCPTQTSAAAPLTVMLSSLALVVLALCRC